MNKNLLLLTLLSVLALAGCGSNQILPDTPAHRSLPPGTKTKDVLMPINK